MSITSMGDARRGRGRRHWLGILRAAAPGWGVLYDPGRQGWIAVHGRKTLLAARTPPELAWHMQGRYRHARRAAKRTGFACRAGWCA